MKRRRVGIALLSSGVALLAYALLLMDISRGGGVVNLDLLNTRQNLVIVGALLTLVGSISLLTGTQSAVVQKDVATPERNATRPPREYSYWGKGPMLRT